MITLGSEIPFVDAGEIVVASDPKATRNVCHIRRNEDGNIEVLSRRDGPSGLLYTLREISESPLRWRYMGQGDDISELAKNIDKKHNIEFSDLIEDSIADVVSQHAIAAAKEMGI